MAEHHGHTTAVADTAAAAELASHHGHGDHVAQFRELFATMLVLAVPTVALSECSR